MQSLDRHAAGETPEDGPPVYSLRAPAERRAAARELARGKVGLFYLGLYTVVKLLRPPWAEGSGADVFWRVKPDRPRWSKLPLIIRPKDSLRLVEFRRVHPAFRHLNTRERWEQLWSAHGAPLHVIAPLREPLGFLHPAFRTSPGDLKDQAAAQPRTLDRMLSCSTASFFWMADDDWDEFAQLVGLFSPPRSYFGGTSFNAHGEQPPYTLNELETYIRHQDSREAELIISDPLFESTGMFSSHTMVRLPLVDEPPELIVTRLGSLTADALSAATGFGVRVLDSVASASRRPGMSDEELSNAVNSWMSTHKNRGRR